MSSLDAPPEEPRKPLPTGLTSRSLDAWELPPPMKATLIALGIRSMHDLPAVSAEQMSEQWHALGYDLAAFPGELRLLTQMLSDADGSIGGAVHAVPRDSGMPARERSLLSPIELAMRARLEKTAQLAKLGGWEHDLETSRGWWSDALYRLFELSPRDTLSLTERFQLVLPEDRPKLAAAVQAAADDGVPYDLELRAVTAKGNPIHVRNCGQPVFEDGKVVRLWGFVQDITERVSQEERLRAAFVGTIDALLRTLETRDPYTSAHQRNVSRLATAIAEGMGLGADAVSAVSFGAMIHDIGKIAVPSEILSRPGKLTDLEFQFIKTHAQVGYDIVSDIDYPWPVADIILQHHERLDGTGYPSGLRGDEISLLAQIVAVADVVEAMSSYRPYRPALGTDAALNELLENRGILYNPDAVDVCVRLLREQGFKFEAD